MQAGYGGRDPYGAGNGAGYDEYAQSDAPGGMLQQGAVMMVYGLPEGMNCNKIFNLFCLYGNVVRVRKLLSDNSRSYRCIYIMSLPYAIQLLVVNGFLHVAVAL